MMIINKIIIFLLLILGNFGTYGQSNEELKRLLNDVGEQTINSKAIKDNSSAIKIIDYGSEIIPKLVEAFTNNQKTKTYSDCQERNLTIGEIAIILVDRIALMPYFIITGKQNCTLTFCEENDNLIEYYISWNEQNTLDKFTLEYSNWIKSEEGEEWIKRCTKNKNN